ncbi:MAG: hypothetical protein KA758_06040 [Acidimicrobiales bacterium]|nr:hypothetical protein [Acidimicrobiales bacterium]HMS87598.1 hypothetical protein [Acidimicrobiales bacterium]
MIVRVPVRAERGRTGTAAKRHLDRFGEDNPIDLARVAVSMNRRDARAYLRSLTAIHLSVVLVALGGLVAFAGWSLVGGPLLVVGAAMWSLAVVAGMFRAVRRGRGKPLFGGDGIQAEANWWLGWGPLEEAAVALNRDARRVRRMAIASLIVGGVSIALWFPVAALAH